MILMNLLLTSKENDDHERLAHKICTGCFKGASNVESLGGKPWQENFVDIEYDSSDLASGI